MIVASRAIKCLLYRSWGKLQIFNERSGQNQGWELARFGGLPIDGAERVIRRVSKERETKHASVLSGSKFQDDRAGDRGKDWMKRISYPKLTLT